MELSFLTSRPSRHGLAVTAAIVAALMLVLALGVILFPWNAMRGPISRYVSGELGRRFEITQHLSVQLGRVVTVRAEGVEFANPEWAVKPYLLKARSAEFEVRLWPLLHKQLVLPRIALTEPEIGLQIEPDGRRTWALSRDSSKDGAAPVIGLLKVDRGLLDYQSVAQGAAISVQFSLAPEADAKLPLSYKASGKWSNEPFTAHGRAGSVLQLAGDVQAPFPIEVSAVAANTRLKAEGTIGNLSQLAGIDASIDLQGRNLEELYKLAGIVLPSTPPYKLRGRLTKRGKVWSANQVRGMLGASDISGAFTFDQSKTVPLLTGNVQSKLLDFEDLGPVIGMAPATARSAAKASSRQSPAAATERPRAAVAASKASRPAGAARKVLPVTLLDVSKLNAMNADVRYAAADIRHAQVLPLDRGSVHVKLNSGVLVLEPVSLGVAGGTVAGSIRIDSTQKPAAIATQLDVRGVQLNQLFPTVETTKSSFGRISGQFDLKGRGNSVAQVLASSSGEIGVLMGQGQISNILLEFMGLDGGEVIKFLVRGDRNVQLRCAATAFNVSHGLMTSRAIVLDTADTVIKGEGKVNFADETLDLLLQPEPKDRSILTFRSPLRIGGTFGAPTAGPDRTALAGRAGIALLLGAINPLLALAATIETGPGTNADCQGVLALAARPGGAPARSGSGPSGGK